VVVLVWMGGQAFSEYLSGYVIEKSLSIDNVFVWAVIFSSFAIPARYQHRVLFWGIFGALVLRATFIFAGTALIEEFWWMLLVFGVVLLFSGFKVLRHKENEGQHGHDRAVKLLGRFLPVRAELADQHFVVKESPGPGQVAKWVATKALVANDEAARALPALKPNQPTHSRHAPMVLSTRLCGRMGSDP